MSEQEQTRLLSPSLVLVALPVYYIALWLWSRYRVGLRLPPGPPQRFLIGNLHQLSKTEPWLTYTSWANTYGPIVHFRAFHKRTILLNTSKAAISLLDLRSTLYSDRPIMYMSGELANVKMTVFQTRFSDRRFKSLRRLLHLGLNSRAAKSYVPIQMREMQVFLQGLLECPEEFRTHVRRNAVAVVVKVAYGYQVEIQVFLQGLLECPEEFRTHVRRNAVAVVVKVAYGYQVETTDDSMVGAVDEGLRSTAAISVPGKYLVEFLPFLRYVPTWFPGAGFKRLALETGRKFDRINQVPYDWARKKIATGNFVESFVSKHVLGNLEPNSLVHEITDNQYSDDVKWAAAALYVGGGDTTVSALTTLFLVMALHPEVQKRAQTDIDKVAPNRLLTLEDYDSLPYIRAIIKEILRWAPVVPLGLAHRATEDDVYEDYFIPKGATVYANIWAITHDEDAYPNPFNFDPSRHLGDSPQPDPFRYVFGFGKRVCPGAHFAEMSLFLNVANVLAAFEISKKLDEHGLPIEPIVSWTTGVIRHPGPFECSIKPRSEIHTSFLD